MGNAITTTKIKIENFKYMGCLWLRAVGLE
jgi:hypothetical protein